MDKAPKHGHDEVAISGLIAEFSSQEELLKAAEKVRDSGYVKTDAYSPVPIHGMIEALGKKPSKIAFMILGGGLIGLCSAIGLMVFCAAIDYPQNVGGRPLISWPMYFPIMFELTVLLSVFTAVFGMIGLNGLPKPYNPLFNVPEFLKASKDAFFIGIEATDPKFNLSQTKEFLKSLHPRGVHEVEP